MRLKTNIVKLPNALDKVSQINGYYYNWNVGTDKRKQVGVIAQEVEKVLPEIVSEDNSGIKSVDYGKLTPLLIEAIKEQQQTIQSLQLIVGALQSISQKLETKNIKLQISNLDYDSRLKKLEEQYFKSAHENY